MVRREFPQVRLIENAVNVGFARANNQAFPISQGKYLLLLNPDTILEAGAIHRLYEFMEEHPEVGGVGPQLLNSDGSLQPSCFPSPTVLRELWRLFHLDALYPLAEYPMKHWNPTAPRPVEVIQGACLLLRRSALGQQGLLDEGYFMYTEEVDLCLRLRRAGWHLFWVPGAKVVHLGGQSSQQIADEMFLRLYESKIQFFRKNYGEHSAVGYKGVVVVATLARLLLSPVAWVEQFPKRQRHLALARNYLRLLKLLPSL